MAASKRVPSPVALPPTRRPQPGPLPPPAEVKEKLYYHSEAVRIRAGQLGEWFTTPLEGGLWTEWGKHAKPDRIGMTFMAINRVSAAPEPSDESAHRLLHSRYIKTHSGLAPNWKKRSRPSMAPRANWIAAIRFGSNMPINSPRRRWTGRCVRPASYIGRTWLRFPTRSNAPSINSLHI